MSDDCKCPNVPKRSATNSSTKNPTSKVGPSCNPGRRSRNPFFMFLRDFRRNNCQLTIIQIAQQGAVAWRALNCQEKLRYYEAARHVTRRKRIMKISKKTATRRLNQTTKQTKTGRKKMTKQRPLKQTKRIQFKKNKTQKSQMDCECSDEGPVERVKPNFGPYMPGALTSKEIEDEQANQTDPVWKHQLNQTMREERRNTYMPKVRKPLKKSDVEAEAETTSISQQQEYQTMREHEKRADRPKERSPNKTATVKSKSRSRSPRCKC